MVANPNSIARRNKRKKAHAKSQATKRAEASAQNQFGVGQYTATLSGEQQDSGIFDDGNDDYDDGDDYDEDYDGYGDWQTVKRRKSNKYDLQDSSDNYPSISHSPNYRLQSELGIHHFQELVLYLLADGTAPQWVAVKERLQMNKVVVLMVPGLEMGMFDGTIKVSDGVEDATDCVDATLHKSPEGAVLLGGHDQDTRTLPAEDTSKVGGEGLSEAKAEDTSEIDSGGATVVKAEDISKVDSGDAGAGDAEDTSRLDNQDPVRKSSKFASTIESVFDIDELIAECTDAHGQRAPDANTQTTNQTGGPDAPRLSVTLFAGGDANVNKPRSPDDYYPKKLNREQLPVSLQPLAEIFTELWPVKTPGDHRGGRVYSPIQAMLTAPLPKSKTDPTYSKGPQPARSKGWQNEPTAITSYFATLQQLQDNGYVIHPHMLRQQDRAAEQDRRVDANQAAADGWVDTVDDTSAPVPYTLTNDPETASRPILALDCEMCKVSDSTFALTRISLLDWTGAVLIDEFVKPALPIVDYLTPYSGITPAHLAGVTTTLSDIQARLLPLLSPHTILVGHSLESDLTALKLTHPHIVDTTLLYPHPRGPPLKSSLKWLAQKYLSRAIQTGGDAGHDSVEDARAALDLVKQKCRRGPKWGTRDANSESIFHRLARSGRTSCVVDWGIPRRGHGAAATAAIPCESDAQVVAGVLRAVSGDATALNPDPDLPTAGVDFVWARLRELEARRGWWRRASTPDNEALLARAHCVNASVARTVNSIDAVHAALPPRTVLLVYTGGGDPNELTRMHQMLAQHREEFKTKKWSELEVKWTDVEEQRLQAAALAARAGIAFVGVK